MKKFVIILALLLVLGSLTVFAHGDTAEVVFKELKSLEGKEIPSNFKSAFGSETVDAELIHEDGEVSYFTVITKDGKVTSVTQERASSPTVKVTVKEGVLLALNDAQNQKDQKKILKTAVKNKDITVKGVGWRRGLRFGFYKIAARFL